MKKILNKVISVAIIALAISLIWQDAQAQIEIRKDAIETSSRSDRWYQDGTKLYTYWSNKWLEYRVELPASGTWTIGLSAINIGNIPSWYQFNIRLYVDGSYKGEFKVPGSPSAYKEGSLDVEGFSSGLHTFRFLWTNDYYRKGSYDANIKIKEVFFKAEEEIPQNQPPGAAASANPTSGIAPLTVTFSGGGTDPDGTIVSYVWNFGDGATSTAQSPTHTYPNPATYAATLTVTDDDGATAEDSVTITVNAPPNQPPTVEVTANPVSGAVPLIVKFDSSAADPDGTIAGYAWDFGDGDTSTEANPTYTYASVGSYTATLTVTDDDGATASESINIMVNEQIIGIPHLIRLEARLGDIDETPLSGTFKLTFRLYDANSGGVPLWEETQQGVEVKEGVVDVKLGSVTALNLPFDQQYWLGVEVESDGEMTPRFKLTTVPYSFRSEK